MRLINHSWMHAPAVTSVLALCLASSTLWAQDPAHLWSHRFGDAAYQAGSSVAADGSGNVVITGDAHGTVDFGGAPLTSAGENDIFLAKFDLGGNHVWSKSFGDVSFDYGFAVATDGSGNVAITGAQVGTVDFGGGPLTGGGSYDIFLAKFDPDGSHLWSRVFGDSNLDIGRGTGADDSGNVLVTGQFSGSVDFGGGILISAGATDIFLAKFDPDGNHLWSRRFGDSAIQSGFAVSADHAGNVIMSGQFLGSVDFGGGTLTSAGGYDAFVAKFDADGNHLWSKRFGDAEWQYAESVITDTNENVVVAGAFAGTVDFGGGTLTSAGGYDAFVAKLDPNGNHLWSHGFGDANEQYSDGVATDNPGNVILTGAFTGSVDFGGGPLTSAGNYDAFVARFDPSGSHLSSQRFGDPGDQYCEGVTTDGSGGIALTGAFTGSVDFGGGPLTSAGDYDVFVAEIGLVDINTVVMVPDGDCLTASNTCETVPFVFDRSDVSSARGISITFELSPELELCVDVPASIAQGTWLDGFESFFDVIDHGGGSYTVDQAILGLPCGVTTGGTLFTVDVAASGGDATGTITVTEVLVRDCENIPLPGDPGPSASIIIDETAPAPITLTAVQDRDDNGTDGTTAIDVTLPPVDPTDAIRVYEKGYGNYPEYDDPPGAGGIPDVPATEIDALNAGWTLAFSNTGGATTVSHEPAARDFWYFVAFVEDECGNISGATTITGGTLNYHLGDVSDGSTPGQGDNQVTTLDDVSLLGFNFGIALSGPGDPVNYLDVGPTTDYSVDARPATDDRIDFEDLVMFAINHGAVSVTGPAPERVDVAGGAPALELVTEATADGLIARLLLRRNPGTVKAIHALIDFSGAELVLVSAEEGDLLAGQGAPTFFRHLDEGAAGINIAILGREITIHGSGEVARLRFRGRGEARLTLADLRDLANRRLGTTPAAVGPRAEPKPAPARLELLAARPNPFNPSTILTYRLPLADRVSLRIYDVSGQHVRTLVDGHLAAGEHTSLWDGRTDRGHAAGSGVYLVRLRSGGREATQKIQLVK